MVHFTTERLTVRDAVESDTKALMALYSDTEVVRWNCMKPITYERMAEQIRDGRHRYVIEADGVVIGEIDECEDDLRYEVVSRCISYNLRSEYTGRGYMRELLPVFVGYCFDKYEAEIVCARVFAGNERSRRLLDESGVFRLEGVIRQAVRTPVTKEVHDDCLYSVTRAEFEERIKQPTN